MSQLSLEFKDRQRLITYFFRSILIPNNAYAIAIDANGYLCYFQGTSKVENVGTTFYPVNGYWVSTLTMIKTHWQYDLPEDFDWKDSPRILRPDVLNYGTFYGDKK